MFLLLLLNIKMGIKCVVKSSQKDFRGELTLTSDDLGCNWVSRRVLKSP